MALLGPYVVDALTGSPEDLDHVLKMSIGFALLLAAATYALRLYINLRRVRAGGPQGDPNPKIRPVPTVLVGALGGLLVGITSVGSGSVIMVALLMLYPGLSAVRLVGTDLVQLRDDSKSILARTFPGSPYLSGIPTKPWYKFWGSDIYSGVDT